MACGNAAPTGECLLRTRVDLLFRIRGKRHGKVVLLLLQPKEGAFCLVHAVGPFRYGCSVGTSGHSGITFSIMAFDREIK